MILLVVATVAVACSTASKNETTPIGPDPSGTTTDAATSGAGGNDATTTSGTTTTTSGAGGSTEMPGDNKNGSRLRARYLVGDDGSRSFVGWYDSQLGANCWHVPAADGKQRCLPIYGPIFSSFNTDFVDAACSQPAIKSAGCIPPAYARASTSLPACGGSGFSVYKIGAKAQALYSKSGNACASVSLPPGQDVYSVGPEIVPATFVAAQEVVE